MKLSVHEFTSDWQYELTGDWLHELTGDWLHELLELLLVLAQLNHEQATESRVERGAAAQVAQRRVAAASAQEREVLALRKRNNTTLSMYNIIRWSHSTHMHLHS